jgi:hypothetical protein
VDAATDIAMREGSARSRETAGQTQRIFLLEAENDPLADVAHD